MIFGKSQIEFLAVIVTLVSGILSVIYSTDRYDVWDFLIAVFILTTLFYSRFEICKNRFSLGAATASAAIALMILIMVFVTFAVQVKGMDQLFSCDNDGTVEIYRYSTPSDLPCERINVRWFKTPNVYDIDDASFQTDLLFAGRLFFHSNNVPILSWFVNFLFSKWFILDGQAIFALMLAIPSLVYFRRIETPNELKEQNGESTIMVVPNVKTRNG